MVVHCYECNRQFDDEYRFAFCPHDTFAANTTDAITSPITQRLISPALLLQSSAKQKKARINSWP